MCMNSQYPSKNSNVTVRNCKPFMTTIGEDSLL